MPNPLQSLYDHGQSFWYDNIRRSLLTGGELARMVREDGLRGLTSNPTIFAKAVAGSADYDGTLARVLERAPEDMFLELELEDIRSACGVFRPLYESSQGGDGYASIEVFPDLARDGGGTVAQARMLWRRLRCPNAMIKIPSTPECLGAIRAVLAEGINVNITLMFGFDSYRAVVEAYLGALEDRVAAGEPVDRVASVASLFVSRVDVKVDGLLETLAQKQPARAEAILALRGRAALANAHRMYAHFQQAFAGPRWERLRALGARPQRLLWASTSTKSPRYPDTYYADALVGPHTVDTMPDATVAAFRDHGKPADRLSGAAGEAEPVLEALQRAGVDFEAVLLELQNEGVKLFEQSFTELIGSIRAKAAELETARRGSRLAPGMTVSAGAKETAEAEAALQALSGREPGPRIWRHDASFWSGDAGVSAVVANRLGWLELPGEMLRRAPALTAFGQECRAGGIKRVVLLGMGGSSLAPEVLAGVFAPEVKAAGMRFDALDTTDPDSIAAVTASLSPSETLFVVSSKSGGTIEPNSLLAHFWEWMANAQKVEAPGRHFIAITDPGTSLALLAADRGFRRVFLNPADIGGRYSALSYFGLAPAALLGIDIEELLRRAAVMAAACAAPAPAGENPGVRLGTALGAWARAGRDKLTFLTGGGAPGLEGVGAWMEQLVAESTGKLGQGIIPVSGEPLGAAASYGKDRIFCAFLLSGDDQAAAGIRTVAAGAPLVQMTLADRYDLGQEFFRWEFATAVAGAALEIDPFDEPNVQESKDNTMRVLGAFLKGGNVAAGFADAAQASAGPLRAWTPSPIRGQRLDEALRQFLGGIQAGDYFAVLAYLERSPAAMAALQALRVRVRDRMRVATTAGFGPSYLHSSGQLHKGGPNSGVYLLLTGTPRQEVAIPGQRFSFGTLFAAQARGDYAALASHQRRVLRVDVGADAEAGLAELNRLAEWALTRAEAAD